MENYICPMDLGHPSSLNGLSHMNDNRPAPPSYNAEVGSDGKVHRQKDEMSIQILLRVGGKCNDLLIIYNISCFYFFYLWGAAPRP